MSPAEGRAQLRGGRDAHQPGQGRSEGQNLLHVLQVNEGRSLCRTGPVLTVDLWEELMAAFQFILQEWLHE